MSDLEVEDTLREIRERVMAESALAVAEPQPAARAQESATSAGNGTSHAAYANGRESLARLQANLATTERAWSRLPPLVSNRRGWTARLELWIKRQIKRAAHWFTWEQVNFNSAVHHALGDARDALAQARLDNASLRESLERLCSEAEADRKSAAELRARLDVAESRLDLAESRFDSGLIELRDALADRVQRLRAEQRALADDLRAERDASIHAREEQFQIETRERIERLLEEQRVCFKQFSLEAGESAAALDRARRQIEARIEALEEKRVEK